MARGNMDGLRMGAHGSTLAAMALIASAALASPPPDYDFDWATIGNINNRAYDREDPYGETVGRGSVPYVYRMSRMEITTAQWREFANAMAPLGETFRIGDGPDFWGAWRTGGPGGPFTLRPDIANPETMPVIGISWYNAARYCNWLHNGKALSLEALVTGAYDTTTWRIDPNTGRQLADEHHLPGAKFWIPTRSEWIKAAHYDPTKDGVGGWWLYPNRSDTPLIFDTVANGGQSNATLRPGDDLSIHGLGLYPDQQSYYGLLDLSGGAMEWLEEFLDDPQLSQASRRLDGTTTFRAFGPAVLDLAYEFTGLNAASESTGGLRIASSIPGPPACVLIVLGTLTIHTQRRVSCFTLGCRRCHSSRG